MLGNRIGPCCDEIASKEAGVPAWSHVIVRSFEDFEPVAQNITKAMVRAGFPEKESLRVDLALGEAIINACKHGHQGDWAKPILVRYHINAESMVAQVEDQGHGFDPNEVPDPRAPENLERSTGRGLFMIRTFMSGVCHNERGNCVCLCKHRSESPSFCSRKPN